MDFQYIKLPDGSYGKFRGDASDDVIKTAITKDFPEAFRPKVQAPANPIAADQSPDMSAEGLVKGFAKNLYQISAPGILTSILNKQAPDAAQNIPKAMRDNAAPAEQLPGQIMTNALPMMVGDEAPIPQRAAALTERPPAPAPKAAPTLEAPGTIARLAKVFARKIPGVKLGEDVLNALNGPVPEPPLPPIPQAPPIPQTNGVPWGGGKYGTPLDQFGQKIAQQPEAAPLAPRYRDATRMNEPYAGEEVPPTTPKTAPAYRDATHLNDPYAGEEPAPKPSAPSYRDSTHLNRPFAGEEPIESVPSGEIVPPKAKTSPIYRDATVNRRNIPDFAGEEFSNPSSPDRVGIDDPKLPWNSTKTTAAPPKTAVSNSPIGKPANANEALARQKTQTKPTGFSSTSAPDTSSTRQIRDSISRGYNKPDTFDDRSLGLSMQQQVEEEALQMEELAKRDFAARNTTGVTKGQLAKDARVKVPSASPSDDMMPLLKKMLKNAQKGKPISR